MLIKEPKIPIVEQVSIRAESHPIIYKSHSDTKCQIDNAKLPNREVHSDTKVE